jgi:tetratricopeptide (TPR) repeat protein
MAAAEARVAIAGSQVLDLLTALVDKSLVVYDEGEDGTGRYRLTETVRQYARDRLLESGEAEAVRVRHRDHFLEMAERAQPELRGPRQGAWLGRLEAEHDNLRAALEWCERDPSSGAADAALRLCAALFRFWLVRGHVTEGRRRTAAALCREESDAAPPVGVRITALSAAGNLAHRQGDWEEAAAFYGEALAAARTAGDERGMATALGNLGNVAQGRGDYAAARARYEESLAVWRALGHRANVGALLNNLGIVAGDQGEHAAARAYHQQSLEIRRAAGDGAGVATSLFNLGNVTCDAGDLAAARAFYEESLALRRALQDRYGVAGVLNSLGNLAYARGDHRAARALLEEALSLLQGLEGGARPLMVNTLHSLGLVALRQGDLARSRRRLRESLALCAELGDRRNAAYALEGLAGQARARGQARRAAGLYGAADGLRQAIGAPLPPPERAEYDRDVAALREALGEAALAAAWAEGRAMSWEDAVARALADGPDAAAQQGPGENAVTRPT